MKELVIRMTEAQAERLVKLAAYRSQDAGRLVSPEECILQFIETTNPGGSWEHPELAAKRAK